MQPRVAVIGCGNIGSRWDETASDAIFTHAGAWHQLRLLTALADADPVRLAAACDHWGINACYQDYRALLATERLDIVSIATPTTLRLPLIEAILAAGVHAVLLEKPVAATVEEAQAIIKAVQNAGAIVAVNYSRRYDPTIRQAAKRVQEGRLGTIQHVVGHYGKGIMENGSHLIDVLHWWLGPLQHCRVLRQIGDQRPDYDPTLDVFLEIARTDTSVPVYLLGVDHRNYALFELDIVGTQGRINLSERGLRLQYWEAHSDPLFPGYRGLRLIADKHAVLTQLMPRAVADLLAIWCGEHRAPLCTLEDAFKALQTVAALKCQFRAW